MVGQAFLKDGNEHIYVIIRRAHHRSSARVTWLDGRVHVGSIRVCYAILKKNWPKSDVLLDFQWRNDPRPPARFRPRTAPLTVLG